MSKRDVLLAKHNFIELKSLTNNARIRSSLKFLLIYGISIVPYASAHGVLLYYINSYECNPIAYNKTTLLRCKPGKL